MCSAPTTRVTASTGSIPTWRTCTSSVCASTRWPPEVLGMIGEFFRFELREQLRPPLLWLIAAMFGLFAFAAATTDAVTLGSAIGNVNRNAPLVNIQFLGVASVLGLFVICIFIGGALLRDFEAGTADLLFASPIRKRDFLIGRFGAGLAASLVVYLLFALGLFIAPYMPWIDPAR